MSRLQLVLLPLLLLCTLSSAQQSKLSADEQAVWKLEHSYWEFVQGSDLEGYRTLWHPDFLGWPYVSPSPVRKDHITDWIADFRSKGLHLESFDLRPADSRSNGGTVVVFYSITAHWVDKNGKGDPATSRITHTWIKSGTNWQIISGMSAAVSEVNK
jgi:ketosteroid isomerase-like protein